MVNIVAVAPERHASKSWRPLRQYAFAAPHTAVPLVGLELFRAGLMMPIAFIEQSGRYLLVALMSPVAGRNFFVGPAGQWLGGYVPAALRGYPFSLVRVEGSDKLGLCVDEDSGWIVDSDTNPDATRFFEEDGEPSAGLKATLDFLGKIEQNRTATDLAVAALAEAGVIQPWSITVELDHQQSPLTGLHRIDEVALNALSDEAFLTLRKSGSLVVAHAQVMSVQTVGVFRQLLVMQQQLTQRAQATPSASSLFPSDDGGTITFN